MKFYFRTFASSCIESPSWEFLFEQMSTKRVCSFLQFDRGEDAEFELTEDKTIVCESQVIATMARLCR